MSLPKSSLVIAGPTLSALLCMCTASYTEGDGEGLLIGSVMKHSAVEVHDRRDDRTRETTDIFIQSFWRCGGFFGPDGSLAPGFADAVKAKCGVGQSVVGWFRSRAKTPIRPSLRELQVHKSLVELSKKSKLALIASPENLVLVLVIGSADDSVLSQHYKAMLIEYQDQDQHTDISAIPMRVTNLLHGTAKEHLTFRTGVSGVEIGGHGESVAGRSGPAPAQGIDFGVGMEAEAEAEAEGEGAGGEGESVATGTVRAMQLMLERTLEAVEVEGRAH